MTSHAMTMAAFYGTISHLQFLRFPLGTRAKRWEHFSMEIQIRGFKDSVQSSAHDFGVQITVRIRRSSMEWFHGFGHQSSH